MQERDHNIVDLCRADFCALTHTLCFGDHGQKCGAFAVPAHHQKGRADWQPRLSVPAGLLLWPARAPCRLARARSEIRRMPDYGTGRALAGQKEPACGAGGLARAVVRFWSTARRG